MRLNPYSPLKALAALLGLAVMLSACAKTEGPSSLEGLPEGSVQTGSNMYMIPTGELEGNGCQAYRAHSPGNMVAQIIYYRKADGSFSANKKEAACMETAS